MVTVAIIQARLGSTRLPGKVLADLAGRPLISWTVAAAQAVPGVHRVAVATSETVEDDAIATWCEKSNIYCHRGPEEDVLERYRLAAVAEGAEVVMRLTADCPFLDPVVCGQVLRLFRITGADYASNIDPPSWPDGLDCEVLSFEALRTAATEATQTGEREHVTPFVRNNRSRFKVVNLVCPIPGLHGQRWTVDEAADLDFARAVAERLPKVGPPSHLEILALLDSEPELTDFNRGIRRNEGAESSDKITSSAHRGYASSNALFRRAERVIPLGSQTFSKSRTQYPANAAPLFLTHGQGARVWDVDGNEYVDLVCGLLPVVLGYRDPDVDRAIQAQLGNGITFSLAHQLEIELAERLVEIVPCAEMVRFGKNGTDATSAAVRLARAFTGRDRIAACGYHGWQDWYVGATDRNKGVPNAVRELTHRFPYNDIAALHDLLGSHRGEFAAVIMEPAGAVEPREGYLEEVRTLVHTHGALFVFDEVITGFRVSLGGAQQHFGVTPDLASFGKSLGNGMPISAVVGRADVMAEMEEIFFSSTFGGETLSLAAAIAVIDKMRQEPVIQTLWDTGERLAAQVRTKITDAGLDGVITLSGLAPWTVLTFLDHPKARKEAIKTLFIKEMLKKGILITSSHNVCYALSDQDLTAVLNAYDRTLARVAEELNSGDLEKRLECPVIYPVFSVR